MVTTTQRQFYQNIIPGQGKVGNLGLMVLWGFGHDQRKARELCLAEKVT